MKIPDTDLSRSSNNFDLLRLLAASFVLIGHSPLILTTRPLAWDPSSILFSIPIHYFGVLIFFIISGFLVSKSWESKKSIVDFLAGRVLRIFPALICVVLLSVFVLGPLLTTLPLADYFSSEITHKYLQDISLYRMYYYLPGVFESNPIGSSINGSLWTLPYEFTCYLFLMILGLLTVLKNKWASLALLLISTVAYILFTREINRIVIPIIGIDFEHFFSLFLYFFSGAVYYQFRSLIPFNFIGLILCAVVTTLIKLRYIPDLLHVFTLPYLVLFFVFSNKLKLHNAGKYGDFSYGIYLYAFPVQQLIVYFHTKELNIAYMILLSFLFTLPLAVLSWKFVERPALSLRKRYIQ